MKKVECPSCGATGVILHRLGKGLHQCGKCKGFGFISITPAKFAKFKKVKNTRYDCTGGIQVSSGSWYCGRNLPSPEYTEFTVLYKVRNFRNKLVYISARNQKVPYNIFYKEHRNPRG